MTKYLIHGKTSGDFAAAMLNKPQNRLEILQPFFDSFGITVHEFVFTSGIEFNFVSVLSADNDELHRGNGEHRLFHGQFREHRLVARL